MKLIPVLLALTVAATCHAQAGQKVDIFPGTSVQSQTKALIAVAKTKGSSGAKLGDYGSHAIQLSIRTSSGGAEVHAHFDDIFVVTDGKATLITGGTVIDPKTGKDGETKGRGIRSGTSRTITKGDIVNIPAGTPHQLVIAPGTIYASIVIKVKEP